MSQPNEFEDYFEVEVDRSEYDVTLTFDSGFAAARQRAKEIIDQKYPHGTTPYKYDLTFISFRFEQYEFRSCGSMFYKWKLEVPR